MHHLTKHLTHIMLIANALLMLRVANVDLSLVPLVAPLAACLIAVEGGLWLLHRRDRARLHVHN
jgi:hypothetical protein